MVKAYTTHDLYRWREGTIGFGWFNNANDIQKNDKKVLILKVIILVFILKTNHFLAIKSTNTMCHVY